MKKTFINNKSFRSVLSMVLVFLILFSAIPFSANADTGVYAENPKGKQQISYIIEYYREGNTGTLPDFMEQRSATVTGNNQYQLRKAHVDGNMFVGEKFDTSRTVFPIALGHGDTAKIYYKRDPSQFKTIKYTVEYILDGVKTTSETVKTYDVPVQNPIVAVKPITKTFMGYQLSDVQPGMGQPVKDGDIVSAYYTKDYTYTKSSYYFVNYYTASWSNDSYRLTSSQKVYKSIWVNDKKISVDLPNDIGFDPDNRMQWERCIMGVDYLYNPVKSVVPSELDEFGIVNLYFNEKANINTAISAQVTYTEQLKGNDFEFEIVDNTGMRVASAYNDAAGSILFQLTMPVSVGDLGKTQEFYVRYQQPGFAYPAKPDITTYKVWLSIDIDPSTGVAAATVLPYEEPLKFNMQ